MSRRLPPGVRHFDYAPLSHVLPRAAALVHHGGIGTAAHGLASGRPQLVMPMTFDQPDNASRLVRLGVARVVWPDQFDGPTVARAVKALTGHPDVARRCESVAARLRGTDPLTRTCELIEEAGVTLPA